MFLSTGNLNSESKLIFKNCIIAFAIKITEIETIQFASALSEHKLLEFTEPIVNLFK